MIGPRKLARQLGAFPAAVAWLDRQPRDWHSEALHAMRNGRWPCKVPVDLGPLVPHFEAQRVYHLDQARAAAAELLIAAVRTVQHNQRHARALCEARFYRPAQEQAVQAAVPLEQQSLLGLGRARSLRGALREAAAARPAELWYRRGGWCSLGQRQPQRAAPLVPQQLSARAQAAAGVRAAARRERG